MAEGFGNDGVVASFDELLHFASRATQTVRGHNSAPAVATTWLGPSALLVESIAGSVLLCRSVEAGSFTMVIPPRSPPVPTVKRNRGGVVLVRVSRDGSTQTARFEELRSLQDIVQDIVPGVVTMGDFRGPLAHTVRLAESGERVSLSVSPSQHAESAPVFMVTDSRGDIVSESQDFASILSQLSVCAIPWAQFTRADGWGLPPIAVPLIRSPIRWHHQDDALSIATTFGLPEVATNVDALQFLLGCCDEPHSAVTSVEELSHLFAHDAPTEWHEVAMELLAKLSAATPVRPDTVDSVTSRVRAILQSADAPAPFSALGLAWRQGALEPPPRRSSRLASPSQQSRSVAASPTRRTPASVSIEEAVNAMSPGTLRQQLVAALRQPTSLGPPTGIAETPAARTAPLDAMPVAVRARHSGQLGGLFTQTGAQRTPASSTEGASTARRATARRPAADAPGAAGPTSTAAAAATAAVPSVERVLQSVSPDGGEAIATTVVIPAGHYDIPVTDVVTALQSHGMPDVVAQFAHAAGDNIPTTVGSTFEAISLLRHMEEVFADLSAELPSFAFLDRPVPTDWAGAVDAAQTLLGRYSSTFRVKRSRSGSAATAASTPTTSNSEDKPPVGSFKQVPTATAAERPGACDAQLLEEMASAAVLRREHVRSSTFCSSTTSTSERDAALDGELAHLCATYGQAATAYIFSNGTVQTALSGYGVPMVLAAVRSHLLARTTQLVYDTVGFERALSMHAKCASLALSFLTGLMAVEDCVALLGGSAPHDEAEIRREGGATSTGTLGSTSGANAQLSIREAFALWGQGLHLAMGDIPGIATAGNDFSICTQLKKVPRQLDDEKLLSLCRFMSTRVGVALRAHRTLRDAPLPDVRNIVVMATTSVYQERDQDQRAEERAMAITGPLMTRLQQLEAAQAQPGKTSKSKFGSTPGAKPQAEKSSGAPASARKAPFGKAAYASDSRQRSKTETSGTQQGSTPSSAQEAAQRFMESLQESPAAQAALGSPASPDNDPATSSEGRITSRTQAIMELSALYRQQVGLPPKGDPSKEPCAYRALFGNCGQSACQRCPTGKSFPQAMVDAVRSRCESKVLDSKAKTESTSGKQKKK